MHNILQILFIFTFLLLTGCAANKSDKPHAHKETKEERQVNRAIALANSGQYCGPLSLTYRKLSRAEVSEYLEMDEKNVDAHFKAMGTHGYYSLIAKNFPPGKEFLMYHRELSGKIHSTKTFYVCPNGTLVTPLNETSVEITNNFLMFAKYLPGEPIDFVLGDRDGEYYVAVRIVPNPVEAASNGKKISVQIDSPDRKLYRVYGEGLEPYGGYILSSNFENEKLAYTLQANENGQLSQVIGPTVPWIKTGEATVELRGDGINRALQLKFFWGLQEIQ